MILDDQRRGMVGTRFGPDVTLDDLLRQAALRQPDALALLDPPDRQRACPTCRWLPVVLSIPATPVGATETSWW